VTAAIAAKDLDAATNAKSTIEDAQRDLAAQRETNGTVFQPHYFKLATDQWVPDFMCVPPSCFAQLAERGADCRRMARKRTRRLHGGYGATRLSRHGQLDTVTSPCLQPVPCKNSHLECN
jgi:hypothetical protein